MDIFIGCQATKYPYWTVPTNTKIRHFGIPKLSEFGYSQHASVSFSCSASAASAPEGLPDSIKRVGTASAFPNEYPGQVYAFNWCLNKDGVTPLRRSAFRITKALDLKVAKLEAPKTIPLKVSHNYPLGCFNFVEWVSDILLYWISIKSTILSFGLDC